MWGRMRDGEKQVDCGKEKRGKMKNSERDGEKEQNGLWN